MTLLFLQAKCPVSLWKLILRHFIGFSTNSSNITCLVPHQFWLCYNSVIFASAHEQTLMLFLCLTSLGLPEPALAWKDRKKGKEIVNKPFYLCVLYPPVRECFQPQLSDSLPNKRTSNTGSVRPVRNNLGHTERVRDKRGPSRVIAGCSAKYKRLERKRWREQWSQTWIKWRKEAREKGCRYKRKKQKLWTL